MKAAVLHGKEDVRIEEIQPRQLEPGEVRIRIEAALTCGTDLKVYKRGYHARMIIPPAVFGHELAGVITELGPGVSGFTVVGVLKDLPVALAGYRIDEVIIAIPSAPGKVLRMVTEFCRAQGIPSRTMPGIIELIFRP